MKSFKILITATVVFAVLFSGCKKEVFTGIDPTKAGVTDFAYDETMSSATTVSLIWNPDQAARAGATSFSVQLAKNDNFSDVDMYDSSIGKTVLVDAQPNDGVVFSGLTEGTRYYARVRANYPRSIFSDWTILKVGDDLACISVGHGILTMSFGAPATLTLSAVSESKMSASWALVGLADEYGMQWKKSSDANWSTEEVYTTTSAVISGLEPKVSYDVRVRAARTVDGNKEYSDYITESMTMPEPDYIMLTGKDAVLEFFASKAATATGSEVYKLSADVDLGGATISTADSFTGVLDGQGFTIKNAKVSGGIINTLSGTIKNLKFSGISADNALVGTVSANGFMSDVSVAGDCSVSFPEPSAAGNYGVLASENQGTIENCSNAASVDLKFAALPAESCNWGAIAGYSKGLVKNCSNSGKFAISITAPTKGTYHTFGGVVGMFEGEKGVSGVVGCSNTGAVSVEYGTAVYFCTGGVVGGTPGAENTPGNYGVIEGCTNEGNVSMHYINGGSGAYPNIGGVVGYIEGQVKGCNNKGKITILCDSASATWTCARLAGVAGAATQGASDCHNYGTLSATALFAGGTAGAKYAGNIATSCFGGVVGSAGPYESDGSVVFENCSNEVDIELTLGTITETPNHHCGGLFGYVTGKIVNCTNKGNITVNCPTAINRLGGIAGGCKYDVSGCSNSGTIKVTHPAIKKTDWVTYIGGIIADASTAGNVAYTKCENSGNINFVSTATISTSRTSALGGILGCGQLGVQNVTFTDCSNKGTITFTSPAAVTTGDIRGGDNYK